LGVYDSQGSAETLVRRGGITNYHLIAYSFSNIAAKNYQSRLMCIEVIAWNVIVVFLRHSVCLREHWLAPFDLHKLDRINPSMICFASSAMNSKICNIKISTEDDIRVFYIKYILYYISQTVSQTAKTKQFVDTMLLQ